MIEKKPLAEDGNPQQNSFKIVRHGPGFVACGTLAFAVDAVVLHMLTAGMGLDPISARAFAISVAMVVGWLTHRRFTFDVKGPLSIREFFSFAAVAWTSAALNYVVYTALLAIDPDLAPLVALVIASMIAMLFSYIGMRYGVFTAKPDN